MDTITRVCVHVCMCVDCALPSCVAAGVESSYCVQVLSSEDGHSHMARTARELCQAVQRQEVGHAQIDVSMVEERCKGC